MEAKLTSLGRSLPVPSVQELVKEQLTGVPARYIRVDQVPPVPRHVLSSNSLSHQVPIIDMERIFSHDSSDSELKKLHLACRDWGFFQLINHGVSCSLLEKVKEETHEFFKMPIKEKKKYKQQEGDIEGYGQLFVVSDDQKLDWDDIFYMVTLPSHLRKPHLFPNLPPTFRETVEEYSQQVHKAALKILMSIAKVLNIKPDEMKVLFEEGMQSIRMNYYPPCPEHEKVNGLAPHSDPVAITFVLQLNEVDGLEIKKDGMWIPVNPLLNAFIVNIGDVLQIVTNDMYKSIEHRAMVNSEKERLSIATFLTANLDGDLGAAPSLITTETPSKFRTLTAAEFLKGVLTRELKGKSFIDQYYI